MAFGIAALANDGRRFELAEIHAAKQVVVLFDALCVRRVLAVLVDREIGSGFADGEEAAEVLADGAPVDLIEVAADDDVIIAVVLGDFFIDLCAQRAHFLSSPGGVEVYADRKQIAVAGDVDDCPVPLAI